MYFADDGSALQAVSADRPFISDNATYLITGGLGGLGQEVASWLAGHGARHLVLLSRSGVNDAKKRAFVAQLQARRVTVRAPCCDVASPAALAALFAEMAETMPPLKGVFHSAAVVDDAPLMEMAPERMASVMAPKAGGGWTLHKLTEAMDLDYFVLFSLISPLVGNSRQANYAAANAFLDALAWHRQLRGLRGCSINWGAISDVGMVSKDEWVAQHLRSIGLTALPVAAVEASERDLTTLTPAMLVIITVLIGVMLGSVVGASMTLVVIVLSIVGAMGAAGFLGIPLSPPSATAPNIIMTLATADCIHLIWGAMRNLNEGMDKRSAIEKALSEDQEDRTFGAVRERRVCRHAFGFE